ncbi:hypothetical protein NDU88_000826 [Pleurodeles waltl]|uniref:Uncharacterized protein n=1 Tax=Pleurodeles waltl TaxID=8319 RepID=A0AAV7LAU0_PLEWA|nr:hypothetical protein NDU88_000826 [Pleurodeles waltl]
MTRSPRRLSRRITWLSNWENGHGKGKMDQPQAQPHTLLETILKELRELKDMQRKETAAINERLDKIEEAMGQILSRLQDLEQRVSDLEDCFLVWNTELGKIQKLSNSQNKMEN